MKDKKDRVIPILEKSTTSTNVMRGRDVVATLQKRNLDPILVDTLAKIAEINHTNTLAVAELATNLDQVINLVQNFANISENMKNKMEQLERGAKAEVEGDEGANSVN